MSSLILMKWDIYRFWVPASEAWTRGFIHVCVLFLCNRWKNRVSLQPWSLPQPPCAHERSHWGYLYLSLMRVSSGPSPDTSIVLLLSWCSHTAQGNNKATVCEDLTLSRKFLLTSLSQCKMVLVTWIKTFNDKMGVTAKGYQIPE